MYSLRKGQQYIGTFDTAQVLNADHVNGFTWSVGFDRHNTRFYIGLAKGEPNFAYASITNEPVSEKTSTQKTHEVIDSKTGLVVKTGLTFRAAIRLADRLDNEYGGCRYVSRKIVVGALLLSVER